MTLVEYKILTIEHFEIISFTKESHIGSQKPVFHSEVSMNLYDPNPKEVKQVNGHLLDACRAG